MILHSRPFLTDADVGAAAQALRSQMVAQGERTAEFERAVSQWVASEHPGVAVGSGSAAIALALQALDAGPGSQIVLPTYVCPGVMEAVRTAGAEPVLCDVGPEWVMTPDSAAAVVSRRTAAIIVPHMYGIFADVRAFRHFGVPLIEDAAQAIGRRGRPIEGDVAVFSFHPTKCLTTGEGGMVVSQDERIAAAARRLRDGDITHASAARILSPMSDLAASVGLAQLGRYEMFLNRRRDIAEQYLRKLGRFLSASHERLLRQRSMFFRFPLLFGAGFVAAEEQFRKQGVIVRRGVDRLLHRMLGLSDEPFPNAVRLFETTVSLPIYPALEDHEVRIVASAAEALFRDAAEPSRPDVSRAHAT